MREYGRWIKNIAAFFLLMALLSLLLPFCRFQAAGEKVELSGMEVLATAGRAGITYARHNEIPDSFVVKEPFTWGEMKNGFSYAQDSVGNKTLLGGAAAIALPVILCVLSMILLAVAEGKKTMVAPTLFVTLTMAEILLALLVAGKFRSYLLTGAVMFALFLGIAFILVWFGWFTGGYRRRRRRPGSREREEEDDKDSSDRKHHRFRRKHSRKKKKKRSKTKGKTTNTKNKNTEGQSENKAEPEDSAVLTGEVTEGHPGDRSFLEKEGCEIFYESDKGQYKICNHSKREIHVQPVTGEIQWILKPGQKARVEDPVSVGIEGTEYVLNLR